MKVLWLVNVALPEASLLMGTSPSPFGGWLINSSKDLSKNLEGELAIAFPQNNIHEFKCLQGKSVKYYTFPTIENNSLDIENNTHLKNILKLFVPDIVHIYGTEYSHSLAMINLCHLNKIECVVSIQGLTSVYANHYMANVPTYIQTRFTFRDLIKRDNLKQQKAKYTKRGHREIETIEKCDHVIGRTTWDRACTYQINPDAKYHFCNETLREEFYKHTWSYNNCEKHSIFISQASYPIKGAHYMLEAMPKILERFPDAKLYIAGYNLLSYRSLMDKLKIRSYGKYLIELIKKNNLEKHVISTGILDERQMCQRYLNSNVFVCPSSIENSPNSLGEAMILGVPCVASDVGGVADMLKHNEEGFVYQADAPYMLAHYVCEIFENEDLAIGLSQKAKEHAQTTHNRELNTKLLIDIYTSICSQNATNQ